MVARILSDPFSYPQVYKTWLVSFLEGSDLNLTPNQIIGLVDLIKRTARVTSLSSFAAPGVAPGYIVAHAGLPPPLGTLICDGAEVSRNTYAPLFAVIGTRYGVGDGTTSFNLPDMSALQPAGGGLNWVISY